MNLPVEITTWKNGKLIDARYNIFSNYRDDKYGVYYDKILKIDLSKPSDIFCKFIY